MNVFITIISHHACSGMSYDGAKSAETSDKDDTSTSHEHCVKVSPLLNYAACMVKVAT